MTRGSWDLTTGLAAADLLCASEARNTNTPGSFKALLSTSTASAISRFDTTKAPWIRPDGMPLLATAKGFVSATYLDVAPGVLIDGTLDRTFTAIVVGAPDLHSPGTLASTCNDWTSQPPTDSASGFDPWNTKPSEVNFGCFTWRLLCLQE